MRLTFDDTIYALSSGAGRAAIAVVRVSGPHVRAVLEGMCCSVPPARYARLSTLRTQDGKVLDEALVLFFPGPRSETGEDICEFQVHGSRAVVASILKTLGGYAGLRAAEPGEFARRALLNGKMSLVEVEALADLIDSETELQRAQAIEGGGSLLFHQAERWRQDILEIRAELEASHDFSDEGDVSDRLDSQAEQKLRNLLDAFRKAVSRADRGERVRDGYRVALMGRPNAGKSSLLNAIAGRDVAIVSAIPGTTRDRIEVNLDLNGVPVVLTDTAGLQDTEDAVEAEGIRRSLEAGHTSDLVVWLSPINDAALPVGLESTNVLVVRTKLDLGCTATEEWAVSAHSGVGIDILLSEVEARARAHFGCEAALLTRRRHREALEQATEAVMRALEVSTHSELCAEELRLAEVSLERLVGRIDVEDVLGTIFARFCVGK